MIRRINDENLADLTAKLFFEQSKGNVWSVISLSDWGFTLYKYDVDCFPDEKAVAKYQRSLQRLRISHRQSVVLPTQKLFDALLNLNPNERTRLYVSFNLERLVNEYKAEQKLLSNLKITTMDAENLKYLQDNLKYMGFGEKQNEALENHLKEGKESFQMVYKTEINKKPFEATLHFRKSDNSDKYFFNSYHAVLERTNGDKMEQTFYLNKGKGVTAKEAYNLLEGRAVYKELANKAGEPYHAWIQLDFDNKDKHDNYEVKQYHENYGYDLKESIGKYAVAELDGGDKEKSLLQSLQKGNVQSVTLDDNGKALKVFVEANPQYKTVTLYNEKMQRMNQEQRMGLQVKTDMKQDVKKDIAKDHQQQISKEAGKPKQKNSRKKTVSV